MRKNNASLLTVLLFLLFFAGCATSQYSHNIPAYYIDPENSPVLETYAFEPSLADRILSLDPDSITEEEIKDVLSHGPAPRVINIHGGIYPVHLLMESFSKFLIFMGYPEEKIRAPSDGSYSYSCYEDSEQLAGYVAWFYEREAVRPLIIGHSQGGIQTVKVLHQLSGNFHDRLSVWNPVTEEKEDRFFIIDPLNKSEQPVVGVSVAYASAVGSGGLTRMLPNQWDMANKLRSVPDSVSEFTGFSIGMDVIGGDMLGFGSANEYKPNGKASVRNVQLPASYSHVFVPMTRHLAKNQEIRDWINAYKPQDKPVLTEKFSSSTANILWAADVWYSIKKHWTLEIQRLVRAQQEMIHVN